MPKVFEKVSFNRPRSSAFDLSHEKKLSMEFGKLVPILCEEILPGDYYKVKTETMLRMMPMIAPIMHRVNLYVHYFFVPNRIVWAEWEEFITGGREGTSTPVFPQLTMNSTYRQYYGYGSLADYLGLPVNDNVATWSNSLNHSAIPFLAYQLIWSEYFRDPNLEEYFDPNSYTIAQAHTMRYRAWEKDYFTSALPWPQRGPEVSLPVEVNYKSSSNAKYGTGGGNVVSGDLGTNAAGLVNDLLNPSAGGVRIENIEDDSISVSINELRTSSAIQRFLEKNARGGYRYIEQLMSHFGVKSSDARLQRPEYLGGGRQPVLISEVLNTSATENQAQGTMAGHGYSVGQTNSFKKRFEEHGYVMGIMSVLPKSGYYQGLPRHFSRTEKLDFYFPEFANLGEQEVYQKELFARGANPDALFGYVPRYAEMKYLNSRVAGEMRDALKNWTWSRIFTTEQNLNAAFVECNPRTDQFAVTDPEEDHLFAHIFNNVYVTRKLPKFGTPTI